MAAVPDLYAILGVDRGATDEQIKRIYRKLARELHPDVNRDPEAERRFKEITAAYQTLSDPARRRQYDLFGSQGGAGDLFPFGDMGDVFDVFFGGGVGGRRRSARRRTRSRRGDDLLVPVVLTFEEAAFGIEKALAIDTLVECGACLGTGCAPGTHASCCTRCGGSGETQDVQRSVFGTVMTAHACAVCEGTGEEIAAPCQACRGDGRVARKEKVSVEVPAGVDDGMELRVAGRGQEGRLGGGPGDLYVSLRVKPHPIFERRGQDLVAGLSVPMSQAALGAEVEVPTMDGEVERVRLEPGTPSGTVLRLRGRGVPNLGRRGRGDIFVTVQVETPSPRSKEERELLERLGELRGETPKKGKGPAAKFRKLMDK